MSPTPPTPPTSAAMVPLVSAAHRSRDEADALDEASLRALFEDWLRESDLRNNVAAVGSIFGSAGILLSSALTLPSPWGAVVVAGSLCASFGMIVTAVLGGERLLRRHLLASGVETTRAEHIASRLVVGHRQLRRGLPRGSRAERRALVAERLTERVLASGVLPTTARSLAEERSAPAP